MIGFGWMQERYEAPRAGLGPFWLGCIAGIVPWIAITIYLVGPGADGSPPGFVYGIFFSLFVLFNCFAINQWLQYKQLGKWKDYLVGDGHTSPCPSSPRACSRGRSSPPPSHRVQRTKRSRVLGSGTLPGKIRDLATTLTSVGK